MASAKPGPGADVSAGRSTRLAKRWCFICGRELLTCRRYLSLYTKSTKDPEFPKVLKQTLGQEVACSKDKYICDHCLSRFSRLAKNKEIASELGSLYTATKAKYHGESVSESGFSSPSPRKTQDKRKAVGSPGTPLSRKPAKKRLFTPADSRQILKAEVSVHYVNRVHSTELSGLWLGVAAALCNGDKTQAIRLVLDSIDAEEELEEKLINSVSKEVAGLCELQNPSLFRGSTLPNLENFSFIEQDKELKMRSPLFAATLHAAAENVADLKKNKLKVQTTLIPGITSAAGILLNCRSQNMNTHQVLTSLALKQSSAKKGVFSHLHSRFMCSSYNTVLQRQLAFGIDFDKDVVEWAKDNHTQRQQDETAVGQTGFQLVMDNVDIVTHPRHTSRAKHGTDLHMVQIIAIKNRVDGKHLPDDGPTASVDSVDIAEFLPTIDDNKLLKQEWKTLTGNIIAKNLPSLSWISAHIPAQIPHPHMANLDQKSEIVNLGVLMENENSTEGIYRIMHHMHKYVPGHGSETPVPIISAGDLLTCEREMSCKLEQRNSTTPSQRLEGLVPVIADFHALANFYQVIWLHLYDTSSSGDKGTLYAARNFLEARKVTSDPMKNINAAADLISQYTIALVIAAAMKFFGMDNISDDPTKNDFDFAVHQDRGHYVHTVLEELVDQYAIPSTTEMQQDSTVLSCPQCQKTYVTQRGLKKHVKTKHPGIQPPPEKRAQLAPDKDAVFNYTRTALSLGMLAYDFKDARQLGDGERIIRLYKFVLLHFKAARKPKYSLHVLRLLAQMKCLLSPRLAHELKWNRFANKTGKMYGNVEVDRELEHQNRVFKESCGGMRGKVTQQSISRISRSAQIIDKLLVSINNQAGIHRPSGKHTMKTTKDHLELAMELHRDNVFEIQAGRRHFHFPDFPCSVLSTINVPDLVKWIKSSLKDMSMRS